MSRGEIPDGAPGAEATPLRFRIDVERTAWIVFWSCLGIEVLIVLLDALISYGRMVEANPVRRLFNITREDSIGTFFSATQTLVVGVVALLISIVQRRAGASRWQVIGWTVLAVFFIYLAADDGAKIHERLGSTFKHSQQNEDGNFRSDTVGGKLLTKWPSYSWQIVFMPVFGAMGIFILVFLWREFPRDWDRLWVLTALACLAAAVGLDFVEGVDGAYEPIMKWLKESEHTIGHFSKSIEEFTEMFGFTLFLVVFIRRLGRGNRTITMQMVTDPPDSE
tara:strand:+ start:83 stop:919 length:837 start_codon:yes stop_codon:yes gene_type:complete